MLKLVNNMYATTKLFSGSCEGWLPWTWQVLQLPRRGAHHCRLSWAWEVQEVQEGRPQGWWVSWAHEVWQVSVHQTTYKTTSYFCPASFLPSWSASLVNVLYLVHRAEHGVVVGWFLFRFFNFFVLGIPTSCFILFTGFRTVFVFALGRFVPVLVNFLSP